MGLFGRRKQGPAPTGNLDAVPALWQWWTDRGRELAGQGEAPGSSEQLQDELTAHVEAVHPELQWEIGPGARAAASLAISAGGVLELRTLAERCVRAAPASDAEWEYLPARAAVGDGWAHGALRMEGVGEMPLGLATVSLRIDDERSLVDVTLHHPAFPGLPEQDRLHLTFMLLDQILGEDDVMRWVGEVAASPTPAADALPADALVETTTAMAGRLEEDTWVLAEAQDGRYPVLFSARRPLRCVDHPLLDQHLLAQLPYAADRRTGFPGDDDLDALEKWEDDLMEQLGDRGRLLVRATSRGVRAFHLYCDSTDAGAARMVRDAVDRWPRGRLDVTDDPGWSAVRRYG